MPTFRVAGGWHGTLMLCWTGVWGLQAVAGTPVDPRQTAQPDCLADPHWSQRWEEGRARAAQTMARGRGQGWEEQGAWVPRQAGAAGWVPGSAGGAPAYVHAGGPAERGGGEGEPIRVGLEGKEATPHPTPAVTQGRGAGGGQLSEGTKIENMGVRIPPTHSWCIINENESAWPSPA